MIALRCFACLLMLSAALGSAASAAEQPAQPAAQSTESDLPAYVVGNDPRNLQLLADAIRSDPNDPRPYYFRALWSLRQGRPLAARADLLIGSQLEARSPDRYPVDQSLAHVPLAERSMLNEFRWRTGT